MAPKDEPEVQVAKAKGARRKTVERILIALTVLAALAWAGATLWSFFRT
jgi:hypothetical protein